MAGVGHRVLSSPQLKHRGPSSVTSYHCCGEEAGEGFLLPCTHHEREKNPREVSLSVNTNVLLEKATFQVASFSKKDMKIQ